MSLSRDTLLFGIALIAFGNWVQLEGFDGALYTDAGITLATIAFLGSVVMTLDKTSASGEGAAKKDHS